VNDAKKILDKWLVEGLFKTYKELAKFLEVAPNTLDAWKQRGHIPKKNILKYTQKMDKLHLAAWGKPIEDYNPSYETTTYQIDLLSVKASAGNGIRNHNVEIIGQFPVPIEYFKVKPNLEKLKAIQVIGDSMMPTLNDDDIVIIEESIDFDSDGIYVINMGSELRVKRLIRRTSGIEIKSDNPTYGSEFINNETMESFRIVGKVRIEIKRY